MGVTVTVELEGPIASAELVGGRRVGPQEREETGMLSERMSAAMESERARLRSVCVTLQEAASKLNEMYEKGISEQRAGIAKLAVEIAARILRRKTGEGDYQITAIVEEALKEAPAKEDITVHLNPQDLEEWERMQEEKGQDRFSRMTFVGNAAVGRAECKVETRRGIIASMIAEQLEKVSKALQRTG